MASTAVLVQTIHAAADPTTSYTFSTAVDTDVGDQLSFEFVTAGTVVTSWQWKVQYSVDNSVWADQLTEETSAGAVTQLVAVRSLPTAVGTYGADVPTGAWRYIRIALKRTGGDATSTVAIRVARKDT